LGKFVRQYGKWFLGKLMSQKSPIRIISLVPSITQTLYDLGLESRVIGITDFCPLKNQKEGPPFRISGPKNPDIAFISKLNPDLILANPEENPLEVIEKLKSKFPTLIFQPKKLNDGLALILKIGKLTKTLTNAKKIISEIKKEMAETKK
jgi:ABC-type Fe3+-hydroxamate transport system substrate-binding protein